MIIQMYFSYIEMIFGKIFGEKCGILVVAYLHGDTILTRSGTIIKFIKPSKG